MTARVLGLYSPSQRLHYFDGFVPAGIRIWLGPGCGLHDHHVPLGIDINRLAVDAERRKRSVVIVEQPPLVPVAKVLMIVGSVRLRLQNFLLGLG